MVSPIYLALNGLSLERAVCLFSHVGSKILAAKVQDLLIGEDAAKRVAERLTPWGPVWADVKLHDTPDTVGRMARAYYDAGFSMLSVHASGGKDMMRAAVESGPYVIGITELTSARQTSRPDSVLKLACQAKESGVRAVTCSAFQVGFLAARSELRGMHFIVPGTRSAGKPSHDQKNVDTPENVLRNSRTAVVVGREVTEDLDPVGAMKNLIERLAPRMPI